MDFNFQLTADTSNPIAEYQVHSHVPVLPIEVSSPAPALVEAPSPAPAQAPVEIPHFTIEQIKKIVIAAFNHKYFALDGFEYIRHTKTFYRHNGRNYIKFDCEITASNTGYYEEHTIYFPTVDDYCFIYQVVINNFADDSDDDTDDDTDDDIDDDTDDDTDDVPDIDETMRAPASRLAPLPQPEDDSRAKRSRPNGPSLN